MLPTPTAELIQTECNAFDEEPYTKLGEEALSQLREHFPRNAEVSHVLLKVIALNKLYSTRIDDVDIDPFARHIAALGIDEAIDQGSPTAVELIFVCPGLRKYYSFATKFCSWHNSTAYPIYDHYVDECLWTYKKQDQFFEFHRQDLYEYDKFVRIVSIFRDHYGLASFSFRQIDKFLWRTGERLLRERSEPL
jgi:hypothetical protein